MVRPPPGWKRVWRTYLHMLREEKVHTVLPRVLLINLRSMDLNPPYYLREISSTPRTHTALPLDSDISPLQGCNLEDTKRRLATLNANTTHEPHSTPVVGVAVSDLGIMISNRDSMCHLSTANLCRIPTH
jgi:hypothetical protein